MKKLLKKFLRRGYKLIKELWKRQEVRPYEFRDLSFKGKLESKFEEEKADKIEIPLRDLRPQNSTYEATRISSVYESIYWRWKRVKEYFEEIEDKYCDVGMKEAKAIMYS